MTSYNYKIRPATEHDIDELSLLICESFVKLSSRDWSKAAVDKLLADSTPEAISITLASCYLSAVAELQGKIAGMVLLSKPNIMKMLFVNPEMKRNGIGRALWEYARCKVESSNSGVTTIELNSTSYALPFYKAIGFVPISHKYELEGAKMTRMACWLRAKELNAEILC